MRRPKLMGGQVHACTRRNIRPVNPERIVRSVNPELVVRPATPELVVRPVDTELVVQPKLADVKYFLENNRSKRFTFCWRMKLNKIIVTTEFGTYITV